MSLETAIHEDIAWSPTMISGPEPWPFLMNYSKRHLSRVVKESHEIGLETDTVVRYGGYVGG